MENSDRKNLTLTGNGSGAGGKYNNVKITGEEEIHGDVDCIGLSVTGTCNVHGSIKANTAKITGTSIIKGNFHAESFRIAGTIDIDGNAVLKQSVIHGLVSVQGDISIEKASIGGQLKVKGNCTSESLSAKGPFEIGGLLNADSVELELHSKCAAREIGGERINIKRGDAFFLTKLIKTIYMMKDFYLGQLTTDTIEGDEIYIEYTKAKAVRGNNVKLGPGCEIGLVEYRNQFEKHEDSKVIDSKKV